MGQTLVCSQVPDDWSADTAGWCGWAAVPEGASRWRREHLAGSSEVELSTPPGRADPTPPHSWGNWAAPLSHAKLLGPISGAEGIALPTEGTLEGHSHHLVRSSPHPRLH